MATLTTLAPTAGLSPLPPESGKAGLRGTLASEWTKLRSVRSTYWSLLALIVVGVGLGALISWATDNHITHLGHGAPLGFDAAQRSQTAFTELGSLVLMVLGAMVITAEYSTGMIRTSLSTMPRRGSVFTAKLIVFTAVALIVSLITSFIAFFVGQALMHSTGEAATISGPNVLRAVIGCALYVVVIGIMSYAFGTIIRHTAGTIATMVGVLFILPLITQVLPTNWINDVTRWLPTSATDAILSTNGGTQPNEFPAWGQLAVTVGYAVILLIIGAFLFRKRDA
jgi:ABC-type transport system involved in multi-copper enzyme maturation permease subunit